MQNNLLRSLGASAQLTYISTVHLRSGRKLSVWLKLKQQQEVAARPSLQRQDLASSPREPRAPLRQLQPQPPQQSQRRQQHKQPDLAKGKVRRKARSPLCPLRLTRHWKSTAVRMRQLRKRRKRSQRSTTWSWTRATMSPRSATGLLVPQRQQSRTPFAGSGDPEHQPAANLRKPQVLSKGHAQLEEEVPGREATLWPSRRVTEDGTAWSPKRSLRRSMRQQRIWNWLRGKASKIDFSDLSDGELNLIAAGLVPESSRKRELGEQYEPPRASSSPLRARKWSNWDTWQPRGRSASRRRSWEESCAAARDEDEAARNEDDERWREEEQQYWQQEGPSAQEEQQQWEQQRGRQRGPRGSSRPPRRERQSDHQEAWASRKSLRSPSKKPKGKQNVWKDVPEHDRNVHLARWAQWAHQAASMMRCHCQIGRQGRPTGPPRDSWMMRQATTWISFPSRTWNGSSRIQTAMGASSARTVTTS